MWSNNNSSGIFSFCHLPLVPGVCPKLAWSMWQLLQVKKKKKDSCLLTFHTIICIFLSYSIERYCKSLLKFNWKRLPSKGAFSCEIICFTKLVLLYVHYFVLHVEFSPYWEILFSTFTTSSLRLPLTVSLWHVPRNVLTLFSVFCFCFVLFIWWR